MISIPARLLRAVCLLGLAGVSVGAAVAATLDLPSAPANDVDGVVRVAWGSPAGAGVSPEFSYFTVDIQPPGGLTGSPTPPITATRYAAWCFDVLTDINPNPAGTLFGGYLYSTLSSTISSSVFNPLLPNHPNVRQDDATWKKVNWMLNRRLLPCALAGGLVPTMWEVQNAIWQLFGQPILAGTGGYPLVRQAVVDGIIADANANAAAWTPQPGEKAAVIFNIDVNWDADAANDVQLLILEVPIPASGPCLSMTKTANKANAAPYETVTYTYELLNCGGTTLTNIVVTDDAGTPNYAGDDFTVGTVASLAPGATAILTAQNVYLPLLMNDVVNGNTYDIGTLFIVTPLASGDIKVTYRQGFNINDNTYGTGAIGWGLVGGHKFGDLTGSDKLEFRFFDKAGNVVLDFYLDTISAATSVTNTANGMVINYPSGYGSLGPFGGDGSWVSGNKAHLLTFSTSIGENLNNAANLPNKAALIINSPTSLVGGNVVIDTTKAPGGWEHINTFTAVVSKNAFTAGGGFGKVTVPDQHNSPNKFAGPHGATPDPRNYSVTNTATAKTGSLTATATATVNVVVPPPVPAPWATQDIGAVAAVGTADYSSANGTFSIKGSGAGITGSKDEYRYVYQAANGDCSIVAKIESQTNTATLAKAGVVMASALNTSAIRAAVSVTPGGGIIYDYRTTTAGTSASTAVTGLKAPYWVKLTRTGDVIRAYRSPDGATWTQIGVDRTIVMGAAPYIGLGVTSTKDGTLSTGMFSNVTAVP